MSPTLKFAALGTATALLLGACSSDSSGNAGAMFDIARTLLSPETTSITLDQAGRVSNATIGMRLGDGNEAMLVLAKFEPGQLWVAGAELAVVTQKGRITETQGLERNMTKLTPYGSVIPSLVPAVQGQRVHTRWFIDIKDLLVSGALMECDAHAVGPESVTILGKAISTVHVTEDCSVPALKWSFTNHYWISPTSGVVWQSLQHTHPKLDPLTIEVLRPASA